MFSGKNPNFGGKNTKSWVKQHQELDKKATDGCEMIGEKNLLVPFPNTLTNTYLNKGPKPEPDLNGRIRMEGEEKREREPREVGT